MSEPCYDVSSLKTGEYEFGEVIRLNPNSVLGTALLSEPWLNWSSEAQRRWKSIMRLPEIRFVGTVLSATRQQVEVTIISHQHVPTMGLHAEFCVTLADFQRFL